jgi:hypothetical protein
MEVWSIRASSLWDLAVVLDLANRREEARQAITEAIAVYANKGDASSLARAESFLATIH